MKAILMSSALAVVLALSPAPLRAADEGMIGKMSIADFVKANDEGAAQIKAVTTSEPPLSEGDQKWLSELLMATMVQEQAAKLAMERTGSVDLKVIAKGEEQIHGALEQKLRKIAEAKGYAAPKELTEKHAKAIAALKEKSGLAFDAAYLLAAGEKNSDLWSQLVKTEKEAKDADLQALVKVTLPLIRMHTKTAKAEAEDDD